MSSHQNHITAVREFMQAFGQETPKEPLVDSSPPPLEVRRLRAKLILEEALEAVRALGFLPTFIDNEMEYAAEITMDEIEFKDKFYSYNFIECLDALCDLDYVGPSGTAVALGISEELYERAFKLVHESNMRKLWTTAEVFNLGVLAENLEGASAGFRTMYYLKGKTPTEIIGHYFVVCVRGMKEGFSMRTSNKIDHCWLVKDKSGKVIKSPSWQKPNLEGLLDA
jgi:predicted HAD superfamily Cof-like phosphohydrolase